MTSAPDLSGRHTIRDGPVPKHVQLSRILSELAVNSVGPDGAIPSERELMVRYGVSRATVRQAVQTLTSQGVLKRSRGKGTFVQQRRHESQLHLASFTQDMRRRGFTPSTRLVHVSLSRPTDDVATSLRLQAGERAWRIDRVRSADDVPIALEHGWYVHRLLPELDQQDLTGSLYELFARHYSLVIDQAEQTVWAESAAGAIARQLDAPAHCPLLVFRRMSRASAHPVEHVVSRYRGDRYQIHMSLTGDAPATSVSKGQTVEHH